MNGDNENKNKKNKNEKKRTPLYRDFLFPFPVAKVCESLR